MRYKTLRLAVIFTISVITIAAWTNRGVSQFIESVPPILPPEGWVIFDENYLRHFQDEPERCFHEARANFFKKEKEIAAEDIRKAAVFMRIEAGRATEEGKISLMMSVHELEKLADKVEKETVTSVKELDLAFARAHLALAKHHYLKAKELWVKKDAKKVGYDLKATALDLEKSLTWFGERIDAALEELIMETCLYAGLVIEGTGGGLKETGKITEGIGKEIEKLSKEIEAKIEIDRYYTEQQK